MPAALSTHKLVSSASSYRLTRDEPNQRDEMANPNLPSHTKPKALLVDYEES
jgi:hypothetical protein